MVWVCRLIKYLLSQFLDEFCAAVIDLLDVSVLIIAEFESSVRCTTFQHPQLPQQLHMMNAGPG